MPVPPGDCREEEKDNGEVARSKEEQFEKQRRPCAGAGQQDVEQQTQRRQQKNAGQGAAEGLAVEAAYV